MDQVDFLLSFVSCESPSLVRARALKYLYFLFGGCACCFSVQRNVLTTLISILEDKELSPNFRCEVLKILHKVLPVGFYFMLVIIAITDQCILTLDLLHYSSKSALHRRA